MNDDFYGHYISYSPWSVLTGDWTAARFPAVKNVNPVSRLAEIQSELTQLNREYTAILDQLAAGLNGSSPKTTTRQPNGMLATEVIKVLKTAGKPQSVKEIVFALEKSGYHWASQSARDTFHSRIYALKGVRKASRGLFTCRKNARH